MPANKDRLYVALHARSGASKMPGGEDKYHWSLIIGPKSETKKSMGWRCHSKNVVVAKDDQQLVEWQYEQQRTTLMPAEWILIRVLVGKVVDTDQTLARLASTPVDTAEGWNCVSWVIESLARIDDDQLLGTRKVAWSSVREVCLWYVQKKMEEHRFDGKVSYASKRVPTWDSLDGKEIVQ